MKELRAKMSFVGSFMPTFSSSFWTQLPFLQDSAKRAAGGGGGSSLRTHSCDVIASST